MHHSWAPALAPTLLAPNNGLSIWRRIEGRAMQRGRCGTSCGLNTGGKWSDLAQYLAQLLHMSHNDTRLPPPCAMCILVNYIFHCRPSIVSAFTKKLKKRCADGRPIRALCFWSNFVADFLSLNIDHFWVSFYIFVWWHLYFLKNCQFLSFTHF